MKAKAEVEKDVATKKKLLEDMAAAKRKAIKAAVDAAIAEEKAKAKQDEAARDEEAEKNRLLQEQATSELLSA